MAVKLHYPRGRGLAEVIRIALGAADIEFEESFIMTKEELRNFKSEGKSLFKEVPLLEIDGLHLSQSLSILRYICRRQDWLGKNPAESARIDMLSEGARDAYLTINHAYVAKVETGENKVWEDAIGKVKTRYLPVFDKVLESTGTGYLVGSSITMCDIVLLDAITWIADKEAAVLEEYPHIKHFLTTMTSLPGIKKFLNGPQRKPYPVADYLKTLRAIFYFETE